MDTQERYGNTEGEQEEMGFHKADGFAYMQIVFSSISVLCSSFIVLWVAPQKPWQGQEPRIRCTLVLLIAFADLLYSSMHLNSGILAIAGVNSHVDQETLCPYLGPLLYFTIFSVYASIGNLSHYAFYRITMRKAEKATLLRWYIVAHLGLTTIFTTVVVVLARVSPDRGHFKLSHGYCVAWQPSFLHYTDICFVLTVGIAMFMGCRALRVHSHAVFYRHRSVVSGYIGVALCVGVFQIFEIIWRQALEGHTELILPVVQTYIILNLLWPAGNFLVFVMVAKPTLAEEEARGSLSPTIKDKP